MTHDATDDGSGPGRRGPDELSVPVPPARRQTPDALPPDLRFLLAEIHDLRLGLSVDLWLTAAAVDAGAHSVARDVIAGTSDDLAAFSVRADHRLRAAGPPAPSVSAPDVAPVADAAPVAEVTNVVSLPAAHPRRARRLALLAPTLTAAAALVGLLVGVVPSPPTAAGPARTSVATAAAASYAALWQLHEQGAAAPELALVARRLHADVARLVELAADDPGTAAQALRLLELDVRVLQDPRHGGALDAELAVARRLVAVLRNAVLGTPAAALLTDLAPLPSAPTTRLVRAPRSLAPSGTTPPVPAPPSAVTDRPDSPPLPALPVSPAAGTAPPPDNRLLAAPPRVEPPREEPPPAPPSQEPASQEPADADDPASGDDELDTSVPTRSSGDQLLP